MEILVYIIYIGIIFAAGAGCSFVAKRLNIPRALLLIILGRILQHITFQGHKLIILPDFFIEIISVIALIVISFDAASRLKIKAFDTLTAKSIKASMLSFLLNLIVLTLAAKLIFQSFSFTYALVFSVLMTGIQQVLLNAHKVSEFLRIQAMIITPFVVVLPFIFIRASTFSLDKIGNLGMELLIGIGCGLLIGLVTSKLFRKKYSKFFRPIALLISVLLTYGIAELMQGNGLLGVLVFGFFWGNLFVKEKTRLSEFSSSLASILEIFVFVLLGAIIPLSFDIIFIIWVIVLFTLYVGLRFAAKELIFKKQDFTPKERIFSVLYTQKGIDVAAVMLLFTAKYNLGQSTFMQLLLMMVLCSIIISAIVLKLSDHFVGVHTFDKTRTSRNW